ncbi:hypothetical protein Scep_024214 [Stephania cephalantha]|uniref:Uncharacterized protein n=1 Tax=Stephania cephalantha TaxID=152367 RepID=A0AAP0HY70_9MAGN
MANQREGGDDSDSSSPHVVSVKDFRRLSDRVVEQGQANFMPDMTMRMPHLHKMLSVIAPVEILIDVTPSLTKNYRKRKRSKRMKRMSEESSSSGLEMPVTTAVRCVHVSPLAPTMASRFPSMSSVVIVPPTFVPKFVSLPP